MRIISRLGPLLILLSCVSANTAASEKAYVDCRGMSSVSLFARPGSPDVVETLRCGEKISILNRDETRVKVRTGDGKEGWLSQMFLSPTKKSKEPSGPTMLSPLEALPLAGSESHQIGASVPATTMERGYADCSTGHGKPFLFLSPDNPSVIRALKCGEEVTVLGRQESWARVQTKDETEGYVFQWAISATSATTQKREETVSDRVPFVTPSSQSSLSLKVLQTEQVPYTVQVGGGQINTNCSITGSVDTRGMASTMGNFTNWSATAYPDLSMSCTTFQTPPIGWSHVLNAMLVVASDGNAYIIVCDAAWRWSKCRGLRPGDIFQARWTEKGLAVTYYTEKGKPKEATYKVLSSKSLR